MRAAVVPEANAKWELRDVPTPKPGENQVLIQIHSSGICYTDVHQTRGELPIAYPRILGHEPVGEIVEVGPGVTDQKVGDRVGVPCLHDSCGRCEWCLRRKPLFCSDVTMTSFSVDGGHAEYMLAQVDATMLLPEGLAYEQAAPIFCAGYTVWSGLRWADPQPGDRVAVVVLGTSNSVAAMAESVKGLRPDGKLVVMGFETEALSISPLDLILKRVQVIGSQQNHPEHLQEALAIAADGKVRVMTETYSLDEVHKAYERVENGQARFRAVLTM